MSRMEASDEAVAKGTNVSRNEYFYFKIHGINLDKRSEAMICEAENICNQDMGAKLYISGADKRGVVINEIVLRFDDMKADTTYQETRTVRKKHHSLKYTLNYIEIDIGEYSDGITKDIQINDVIKAKGGWFS
jgi:hypothetical protein